MESVTIPPFTLSTQFVARFSTASPFLFKLAVIAPCFRITGEIVKGETLLTITSSSQVVRNDLFPVGAVSIRLRILSYWMSHLAN